MPVRPSIPLRVAAVAALWLGACPPPARAHPDLEFLERAVDEKAAERPDDPELILKQGRLREMARDWDGALVAIEHAREHGADPDVVAAARARVFRAAGFPHMAKLEYDRVLAKRPEAWELLFERGRVQLMLGRLDDADDDFARAIANMKAPHPEQVVERRDALLARGMKAQAVRALDDGMARLGPVASLELPAIDLDLELGNTERALARIDTLLKQSPSNEAWIARRGEILARAGRPAEARAEYARALAGIETRQPQHRNKATEELEARLRTTLASAGTDQKGKP